MGTYDGHEEEQEPALHKPNGIVTSLTCGAFIAAETIGTMIHGGQWEQIFFAGVISFLMVFGLPAGIELLLRAKDESSKR